MIFSLRWTDTQYPWNTKYPHLFRKISYMKATNKLSSDSSSFAVIPLKKHNNQNVTYWNLLYLFNPYNFDCIFLDNCNKVIIISVFISNIFCDASAALFLNTTIFKFYWSHHHFSTLLPFYGFVCFLFLLSHTKLTPCTLQQ